MGIYTSVKSKFIKEKIKKTTWEDSNYIDDLIFLERSILDGIYGIGGNIKLHNLVEDYSKEYEAIYKELKPKEWKDLHEREKKEKEAEKRKQERFEKLEREEEEQDRKDWIKAKGKK